MSIPKTQIEIWNYLNKNFGSLLPEKLPLLSDAIDGFVPEYLTSFIAYSLSKNKDEYLQGSPYFYRGGYKYRVTISLNKPFSVDCLDVGVMRVGVDVYEKKPKRVSIDINTIGPYNQINLYLSSLLNIKIDRLLKELAHIISSIYGWLLEAIRVSVKNTEEEIESRIISIIRRYFTSSQLELLLNSVWIIVISNKQAYYAIDSLTIENIINKSRINPLGIGLSPAKNIAEFISNAVPFEKTFSKEVLKQNNGF